MKNKNKKIETAISPSGAVDGSTIIPSSAIPWDNPNIDPVKDTVTPETWRLCQKMGMIPSHLKSYE